MNSFERAASRIPEPWRGPLSNLGAFVAIAIVVTISRVAYVAHGMCFNDPSWYFHWGKRLLDGAVPYRDYIFQVGPLPIFIDALFQKVFGSRYVASLYAAIAATIVRVFIVWLIGRRIAGVRAAALLAIFCAFDPIFSFAHHWSTPYAQLFITLSGLFFVLAAGANADTNERKVHVRLACAGASAALVVSARQSSAVTIGFVLFVASAIMLWRGEFFTRKRFVALWGGFAGGLLLAFLPLAAVGALRPSIQQMFLDAPAKKAVHGLDALLDAISGGALIIFRGDSTFTWWGGFLVFIGLPALIVAAAVYILSRKEDVAGRALAVVGLPTALLVAMFSRYASLNLFSDLPRTFLTVSTVIAVLFPKKCREWFGVEAIVAVGLGTLGLASDWAMEMSFPGRGWGDAPALTVGAILFFFASRRLVERAKVFAAAGLALVGVAYFVMCVRADVNPFAKDDSSDGTLIENRFEVDHPMLRGLRVNESRMRTLEWLRASVRPGSTCFVYGNLPVLYSLLECKNITAVDSTVADFITAADAEAAIAALRQNPPDYIIAHEKSWMNPPLYIDLEGKLERYDGMNPKASKAMHMGLRSLMDQYETIGRVADVIGPDLAKQAAAQRDIMDATRIYRRKTMRP